MDQEYVKEAVKTGFKMLFWFWPAVAFALIGGTFQIKWFFIPSAVCLLRMWWIFGRFLYKWRKNKTAE